MKLERTIRSAARLPGRLARGARTATELARWAIALRLGEGLRRRAEVRLLRRSAVFDVPYYLAQCDDDPAARANPWGHYLAQGARRGLAPSPLFDGAAYLARTPAAVGVNPLVHYLEAERARAATPPPPAPAARPDAGEALLLAHPFPTAPEPGSPPRVLVLGPDPATPDREAAELARALGASAAPTLLPVRAGDDAGATRGADAAAFDAAVNHLAAEGHRYAAVIVCGLERAARLVAPLRAHAPWATLACTASDAVALAACDPADPRRRAASVAAACADAVLAAPAEAEAVRRLAPGARLEATGPGAPGLERLVSAAPSRALARGEDAA